MAGDSTATGAGGIDLVGAQAAAQQMSQDRQQWSSRAVAASYNRFATAWGNGSQRDATAAWVQLPASLRAQVATAWATSVAANNDATDEQASQARAWAEDSDLGASWLARTWAARTWAGDDWAARTWAARTWAADDWAARTWAARTWAARTWAARTWAARTWAADDWSARTWAARTWAADDWSARTWAARSWAARSWAFAEWGYELTAPFLTIRRRSALIRTRLKPLPMLIAGVLLLGAILATWLLVLPDQGLLTTSFSAPVGLIGLVALAAFAELAYVRVPHGDITEDLTFFEAIVVMAALVLPPLVVVAGALGGLAVAWIIMRRAWVKTIFNFGMFAAATSTMLIVAHAIGGQHHLDEVDLRLVLALMAGTAAFGAVNLLALAAVVFVVEGVRPLGWLRAEIVGSLVMVGGNVGVAVIFVSMAMSSPILLPFVGLPVLALVHSFKQSQRHARERERANALVELSSALTASGDLDELIEGLLAPLRKVFDADRAVIEISPDAEPAGPGDRVVVLDLGDGVQGNLVLGWDLAGDRETRPFPKRASGRLVDEPLLATTASAVSSVLRSARHLAALTEESSKLQAVIDHATDGIAVVDSSGAVLVWSPSMRALVGDPPPLAVLAEYDDAVVGLLSTLARIRRRWPHAHPLAARRTGQDCC